MQASCCRGFALKFVFISLAVLFSLESSASALDLAECSAALGMENGEIPDSAINASSSFDESSVGPSSARIRTELAGGAWCPQRQIDIDVYEWLQIDFAQPKLITAVETQGRFGSGKGLEYPTHFRLEYWRPGFMEWRRYKHKKNGDEILPGNSNTYTPIIRELDPPMVATSVRLVPYSAYPRTVCMRVEIYGCNHNEGLLSYSIPDPKKTVEETEPRYVDNGYDGSFDNTTGFLVDGLGELYDGRIGSDDPEDAAWVGWKAENGNKNVSISEAHVTLLFQFDAVRNFSEVSLYLLRMYRFQDVKIWFSVDGKEFQQSPISKSNIKMTEGSTSATWAHIDLRYFVASVLKIGLSFNGKRLVLSEVEFHSEPTGKNTSGQRQIVPIDSPFAVLGQSDTAATDLESRVIQGLQKEYILLIAGVMVATGATCLVIVVAFVVYQKRQRKFCSSSIAACKEFKLVYQADDNNKRPDNAATSACAGTAACDKLCQQQQNLVLVPQHSVAMPARTFYFPPPPPFSLSTGDSSEDQYTEPCISDSSATLPLLSFPSTLAKCSAQSLMSRSRLQLLASKQQHFQASETLPQTHHNYHRTTRPFPSVIDTNGSLHYASSSVPSSESTDISNSQDEEYSSLLASTTSATCASVGSPNGIRFPVFQRSQLKFLEKLGDAEFGTVELYDCSNCATLRNSSTSQTVALKLLRHTPSSTAKIAFQNEVKVLSRISHRNVAQLLSVCTTEDPWCMVVEYTTNGDLNQYLQLNYGSIGSDWLFCVIKQIASGMAYLESLELIHGDLAARNCLVGDDSVIKISDLGMARELYCCDYYYHLPIRWMPWESILTGDRAKQDVWAFGVTLWEIYTFGLLQPYHQLSNPEVVNNAQKMMQTFEEQLLLPKPVNCPADIFDLTLRCWHRNKDKRPTFADICKFLNEKSMYNSNASRRSSYCGSETVQQV